MEQAGSGPVVLLLHGWGSEGKLWRPVVDALSEHHLVVAPDFPGFGGTPPPPAAWSAGDYARWTLALLDRLGIDRADIVSHSFGGRVAVRIATSAPGRVGRIVLADTSGIVPKRTAAHHLRVRTYKSLKALAMARVTPRPLQRWATHRMTSHGSADYRAANGTVRQSFVRIVNEDFRAELPRVAASTLLIWGDRDEETPIADARIIERLIPDAGLVVFEGCGHYAYAEEPQRFCRIIRAFLGGAPV